MLEHEWRELEVLCERISDLRHRQSHALRSRNVGLCEGLREDIARAQRQRELLVRHISARLGSAAAHFEERLVRRDDAPPDDAPPTAAGPPPDDEVIEGSGELIGFSREYPEKR